MIFQSLIVTWLFMILDIHKCLMEKHNIKKCLNLFKKMFVGLSSFGGLLASDRIRCASLNN